MKNISMAAAFAGILLCGNLFAQNTTPANPNAPQAQPSAPSPAEPQAPAQQPNPNAAPSQTSANQGQAAGAPKIAPGSVIPVQLAKTIDAKKAKTGDLIEAKVTQDMKNSSGDVLVPKDTKVMGHVTEAQARSKEQKESQLGIAFDRAVMKGGGDMQLPMSIQAIIGQQNNNAAANGPGGYDQGAAPSPGGSPAAGGAGRMSPGMSGGSTPPTTPPPTAGGGTPSGSETGKNANPPINGQTQGVIGISNLTLSPGANATQGSVLTSDKNNVKLESGTMLLLKVSQ